MSRRRPSSAAARSRRLRSTRRSAYASTVSPLRAASITATSIFFMGIIASKARLAAAVSGLVVASSRTRGVSCLSFVVSQLF
jgi:hypothetical protein